MNLRILSLRNADELRAEIRKIGVDAARMKDFVARGVFQIVKLEHVNIELALSLQQEPGTENGAFIMTQDLRVGQLGTTDILFMGTVEQFHHLCVRLRASNHEEAMELANELDAAMNACHASRRGTLRIGPRLFEWGTRTFLMGIINVTPDSFSGDGLLREKKDWINHAFAHAKRLVDEGVDILDIGGESTRPGAVPVSLEEELNRILPILERLTREIEIPISIDTYKATVAQRALDAGAQLINDVWGGRKDSRMLPLVANRGIPIVLTHNRRTLEKSWPEDTGQSAHVKYTDLMAEIVSDLRQQIQAALDTGIEPSRIIVDPGFGFGKRGEQNVELLRRLKELCVLGCPILIGPSRKLFVDPIESLAQDRVPGSIAAAVLGIIGGADIVRVHDVLATRRAARLADPIVRNGKLNDYSLPRTRVESR